VLSTVSTEANVTSTFFSVLTSSRRITLVYKNDELIFAVVGQKPAEMDIATTPQF
jgi:hypothetical protein